MKAAWLQGLKRPREFPGFRKICRSMGRSTRSGAGVRRLFTLALGCMTAGGAAATDRYVGQGGQTPDPVAGYTSSETAASNVQEVINLAATVAGDRILIAPGRYLQPDAIACNKAVTLRSQNAQGGTDPELTILDANNYAGKPVSNRCLTITAGVTIDGLTLTGGRNPAGVNQMGGGAYVLSSTAVLITNCILAGNTGKYGGGLYVQSSPATIVDCRIVENEAVTYGGGAYLYLSPQACLQNSVIGWNAAPSEGSGVGINGCRAPVVTGCDIVSNRNASAVGFISDGGMISDCRIRVTTNLSAAVRACAPLLRPDETGCSTAGLSATIAPACSSRIMCACATA